LQEDYKRVATTAGFELSGELPAGQLRIAEQQQVEILRALSRDAQVIIMDEPSAALNGPESAKLHRVIRSLAAGGKTILLISHFLREVLDLADTITVLRDGRIVANTVASGATEQTLVEAMLGRPLTAAFPAKHLPDADAPVVLSVSHLHAPGVIDASLEVRAGEIVGLAGLVGAGRSELARAVFGATRSSSGEVSSADLRIGRSPKHSLSAGVAMIPESRQADGLILTRSVLENVSLGSTASPVPAWRRSPAASSAGSPMRCWRAAMCAAPGPPPVRDLSGGNQQKVLFARTVLCSPSVVIADEPTRVWTLAPSERSMTCSCRWPWMASGYC